MTPYPEIVKALYILKTYEDKAPILYRVDVSDSRLVEVPVPDALQTLRRISRPRGSQLPPLFPSVPNMLALGHPIRSTLQPLAEAKAPEEESEGGEIVGDEIEGWTIAELDEDVILMRLVPSLAERHFLHANEMAYRVALVTDDDEPRILYSSDGTWTSTDIATPDASLLILGGPATPSARGSDSVEIPSIVRSAGFLPKAVPGRRWLLVAQHRLGSLEVAANQVRQRSLAISLGIVMILGAGIVTLVVASQRASSLGRLQLDFATGISHELRTPLMVLRSAAHNLQSGIIEDKEDIQRYASIVEEQVGRLSEMVDQTLMYSSTQMGRRVYDLRQVDVQEIIQFGLLNLSPTVDLERSRFSVEIEPDVHAVLADSAALTFCVQNLLSNAFKYGRSDGLAQIEIRARKDPEKAEVHLSVRDHGPGIDAVHARHLFSPFYRGAYASSNTPGNGLGLYLVQQLMHAQHGRVTFEPAPEHGAIFTLHIPVMS
jgi:signal transduction histidine kinase